MAELITTSEMAKTVVSYLAGSLKESKALKSFFTDFTDATVQWLRPIFLIDDKEEKRMIKDLIENPDDTDNLQEIETAIIKTVKKQPELESSLVELFKEIQTKTGNSEQKTNTINDSAKELLEKAMRSDEANFGTNHPTTAVRYSNLALVLQDLGDYAGAKALLEKAMLSDEANFGSNHPTTAVRYSNLATVLQALGDYAGAKALLEKAMRSAEANFGTNHPTTAVRYSNLALVLSVLKEYERAILLAVKAYRIYAEQLGQQHPNTKIIEGVVNGITNKMLQNGYTMEDLQKLINK